MRVAGKDGPGVSEVNHPGVSSDSTPIRIQVPICVPDGCYACRRSTEYVLRVLSDSTHPKLVDCACSAG